MKNELNKIQKAQIKQLEEYNLKLVTMINEFFNTLKKSLRVITGL